MGIRFEAYENNGGGLSLYVIEDGKAIYGANGFEENPGTLKELIEVAMTDGVAWLDGNGVYLSNAFYSWPDFEKEPNGCSLQAALEESRDSDELIAEGDAEEVNLYFDRMGSAAAADFAAAAVEFAGGLSAGGGRYVEFMGTGYVADDAQAWAACRPVSNPAGIRWDERRAWVQEDGRDIEWL